MKGLLLDQGLAPLTATILRRLGLDAVHVSEIGMERAEDLQILERARIDDRVCVMFDHDFHAHLAAAGHGRPSVVLQRVQGLDGQGQADLIRSVCLQCEDVLAEGAAVSPIAKVSASGDCHSGSDLRTSTLCRVDHPQFMPHMPGLLHRPLGQEGISALFDAPFARAEKVESSCCRCFWPQDGHSRESASAERRTNFSNLFPQSAQRYS
jgi:predicted nuclease of predicted toxin-antitoxin system